MKKYSVALLRERLAHALDEADRGVPVLIERRGVTYRLSAEVPSTSRKTPRPRIEVLDAAVEDGRWTWDWTPAGVKFTSRRRR